MKHRASEVIEGPEAFGRFYNAMMKAVISVPHSVIK